MNDLRSKSVFIFDLDGTLYSQKKTRLAMAWKLFCHYFFRMHKIKELKALYLFRKYRERSEFKKMSMRDLYGVISGEVALGIADIEAVVNKWMFDEPLRMLKRYAYKNVIDFIQAAQEKKKTIIIYSDYPVDSKLKAMGISPDLTFTSEDERIRELKPSQKAMRLIAESVSNPKSDMVYIGDRDEKDRRSAELIGIPYYDIKLFRKSILVSNEVTK